MDAEVPLRKFVSRSKYYRRNKQAKQAALGAARSLQLLDNYLLNRMPPPPFTPASLPSLVAAPFPTSSLPLPSPSSTSPSPYEDIYSPSFPLDNRPFPEIPLLFTPFWGLLLPPSFFRRTADLSLSSASSVEFMEEIYHSPARERLRLILPEKFWEVFFLLPRASSPLPPHLFSIRPEFDLTTLKLNRPIPTIS